MRKLCHETIGLLCSLLLVCLPFTASASNHTVKIAEQGVALCTIEAQADDATSALAVSELQHYLGTISGANFTIQSDAKGRIIVCYDKRLGEEEWRI